MYLVSVSSLSAILICVGIVLHVLIGLSRKTSLFCHYKKPLIKYKLGLKITEVCPLCYTIICIYRVSSSTTVRVTVLKNPTNLSTTLTYFNKNNNCS